MATTSNPGAPKAPTTKRTTRKSTSTRTARTARSPRSSTTTTSTQPKTRAEQVQVLAERAVLVPVGASLLARDNLVSTVKGLGSRYSTRASVGRELKRYERRGVIARNRVERRVRRTRARFERELRQRRSGVERAVTQNRRQFERQVRAVQKDLGKQSGIVSARVEKLVTDAQGLIGSAS
jgi:hypothetical protein